MKIKIILFAAVCLAAAAAFAAYVDQSKKTAAMDTITTTNNQAPQRGSSSIQFTKSGTGPGVNQNNNHSGGGTGGGGGYTGGGTGSGGGTAGKTPCPATCPSGQTRDLNVQYAEDGSCCSDANSLKTPCSSPAVTCPEGQAKTNTSSTSYYEDGSCCSATCVAANQPDTYMDCNDCGIKTRTVTCNAGKWSAGAWGSCTAYYNTITWCCGVKLGTTGCKSSGQYATLLPSCQGCAPYTTREPMKNPPAGIMLSRE